VEAAVAVVAAEAFTEGAAADSTGAVSVEAASMAAAPALAVITVEVLGDITEAASEPTTEAP